MCRTNTITKGSWWTFFYEGDEWTYSLYAPHDIDGSSIWRASEGVTRRLDYNFTHGHYDVTNESRFMMPMLYLWAGRPDRTADVLRLTLKKDFTETRTGIPWQ